MYIIPVLHVDNPTLSSVNQVIENCPVTGIQVRTDDLGIKKVKAVETPHGTIETPCVVNCAGEIQLNDNKTTGLLIVRNKQKSKPGRHRRTGRFI